MTLVGVMGLVMVMVRMLAALVVAAVLTQMVTEGEIKLKKGESHKSSRKDLMIV